MQTINLNIKNLNQTLEVLQLEKEKINKSIYHVQQLLEMNCGGTDSFRTSGKINKGQVIRTTIKTIIGHYTVHDVKKKLSESDTPLASHITNRYISSILCIAAKNKKIKVVKKGSRSCGDETVYANKSR